MASDGQSLVTCSCRKFAPSPDCDRPEHTAPDRRVSSPAFYEERIRQLEDKLARLKKDYLGLSRWAGQQNAGNAFATQVRMSADARVAEWDLPLEEWEP